MGNPKVIILVLVLIGVVAFMALGAGAYQDQQGLGDPPNSYTAGPGVKRLDGATGWMRSKLDSNRMKGPCVQWPEVRIATECYGLIDTGPGRPSGFKLRPAGGTVELCYAFSRAKLDSCVAGLGKVKLDKLRDEASFTVARDPAFLYFRCSPPAPAGCVLRVR